MFFSTEGSGTPTPLSKQVKYLGAQTDNVFSKMNFKVCYWHSSPSLRKVTAATGPSFLAAVDLITTLKIFTCLLIRTCFFSLPLVAALEGSLKRHSKLQATTEG